MSSPETRAGMSEDERYIIKPVLGAFRALEALAHSGEPLSLTEIAERAALTKTTAFRYLRTLTVLGYTVLTREGKYELGPATFVLSNGDTRERALRAIVEPVLRELAIRYGETANLAIAKGKRIHYLTILEGTSAERLPAEVGDSDCLHCTALGKAILAFTPAEERSNFVNNPLPRFTENTITVRRELDTALAEVRRWGYAIDREENDPGCVCYGAPILDEQNRPVAAISVSLPKAHLTTKLDIELAEAVLSAARGLSARWLESRAEASKVSTIRSARGARPQPAGRETLSAVRPG